MITRYAPLALLLAFVAMSAWLLNELSDDPERVEDEELHVPDFYMTNFTTVTMDELGRPSRRLEAEDLSHFVDTDTKELEKPYMIVYNVDQTPWHVRSERGWVSANDDVMLLLGDVHIWRDGPDGVRELDVRTRDLRVLPETQYGETDKAVVIRTPNSESRGIGMRAYLEQRRIELLSQVQTTYERNPR